MGAGASSGGGGWREQAVVRQVQAHGEICGRLGRGNCEPNFADALKKARSWGVVDSGSYDRYRAINREGNRAKHWWN